MRPARRARGFTLIELLVAISVMAVLALLSWRGIDALVRSQQTVRERMDQVATVQTGLTQWTADLDAMVEISPLPMMDFDGRVLRLIRVDRSLPDQPLRVVGWSRRVTERAHGGRGSWMRWHSPPLRDRQALDEAWARAQRWGQAASPEDSALEVAVVGLDSWQLLYFRNNAWSNPLSSAGTEGPAAAAAASATPEAIRLVLRLSAGQPLSGELTRDWLRPATSEPW